MSYELDSEEVIRLPFIEIGSFPEIMYGRKRGFVPVGISGGDDYVFPCGRVFQMVHAAEALFSPVHASKAAQEVETSLFPQEFRHFLE